MARVEEGAIMRGRRLIEGGLLFEADTVCSFPYNLHLRGSTKVMYCAVLSARGSELC